MKQAHSIKIETAISGEKCVLPGRDRLSPCARSGYLSIKGGFRGTIHRRTEIDTMNQEQMAYLWRFAPSGHPFFRDDLPLYDYFKARFGSLGGMSVGVSKKIGWG